MNVEEKGRGSWWQFLLEDNEPSPASKHLSLEKKMCFSIPKILKKVSGVIRFFF